MQAEGGRQSFVGKRSRDRVGRRKRDTAGRVVIFPLSSPLTIIWYGLGAVRVRSTESREVGKPTGTSLGTQGVATVVGGRQGIGECKQLDEPGATAPAGKGKVRPRLSEFKRAYVFCLRPVMAVSSALFKARNSNSRPCRH